MKEIIFNNNILQKDNRVKIPNAIIDSLEMKEGQAIKIILDTEEECIIIKKNDKNK